MLCTRSNVEVGDYVVYTLMELPCSSLEERVVGVVVTMKPCGTADINTCNAPVLRAQMV